MQTVRGTGTRPLALTLRTVYDKIMKVRDIVRVIEKDGWRFHSQRGSHSQYVHPVKKGRVTVPGNPGDDLDIGTLRSIYRQAQIRRPQ